VRVRVKVKVKMKTIVAKRMSMEVM